ncbi:uncharacterized protein LOC134228664 isoform X1 [Saccostrea cucullata]|uniref:uncharacterized protein LOC134228664 isoform X1 n=1 Tax=Saccostrea cuccullata TaxID=36930 RepID=UPI002ED4CD06
MRNGRQMAYKLSEVQKGNGTGPGRREVCPDRCPPRGGSCDCGLEKFLPRWTQWIVCVVTMCVRIHYIGQPQSLWILHPDEIFQTVEVAFSEYHGYGFRFYDYLPPPTNATSVEEQELLSGMFSLRSFLLPRIYMLMFAIADFLGVQLQPLMIARTGHVIVTSLLPLAVYYFVRRLYPCVLTSQLAAIFTACSLPLSVLGTHALDVSLLSPFVIAFLTPLLGFFLDSRYNPSPAMLASQASNQNGHANITNATKSENASSSENVKKDHVQKKTSNVRFLGIFQSVTYLFSGFILGIACYIRIDSAIFIGTLLVTYPLIFIHVSQVTTSLIMALLAGCGFVTAIWVGGYEDLYRYGSMFISPFQWMNFNIKNSLPSTFFGDQKPLKFLLEIFFTDIFSSLFIVLAVVGLFVGFFRQSVRRTANLENIITVVLIFLTILQFASHFLMKQLESRHLHNVIVLVLIICACSFHHNLALMRQSILKEEHLKVLLVFFLGLYALNSYSMYPSPTSSLGNPWTYPRMKESRDVNSCLQFISHRSNVTGVFADSSLYLTHGYTIINHNVPLLILIHNEYHEYRSRDFLLISHHQFHITEHIRIMNRFTDFVYKDNEFYLKKLLLGRTEYNYVICDKIRAEIFMELGFQPIYTTEGFLTLYRNLNEKEARKSISLSRSMVSGENATLLEYEGSWLYTVSEFDVAAERLEKCLETNDSRWRPFQLLGMSYVKMKKWDLAKDVERRCFQRHGEQTCRQKQARIILDENQGYIGGV